MLINTDRKVESKIIKDYFNDKCDYKAIKNYKGIHHSTKYYLLWSHFYWDINFNGYDED